MRRAADESETKLQTPTSEKSPGMLQMWELKKVLKRIEAVEEELNSVGISFHKTRLSMISYKISILQYILL